MKSKWSAARSSALLILISAVVGTAAPAHVRAASLQQEGTETWGSFTIPAADRGQLLISPQAPRITAQQQALIEQAPLFSHLPGPETPTDPNATILDGPPTLGHTEPPGRITMLASGTLTIFSNDALSGATAVDATGQSVSPSAANNGSSILLTYNYHAALSTDYGDTWGYIDPATVPPGGEGVHGGFAGDQDVLYDPSRDLMVWTLRYIPNATGNQLRLVVLDGVSELQGAPVDYLAVTLTPEGKCAGTDTADWFDAPQLALTDNFLYVSANVFRYPANTFTCSIVMRIPLDNLDAGPYYDTTDNLFYSSAVRTLTGAHGGTDTFYFAAHFDNDTLRIYDWPESAAPGSVTSTDVNHASYLTGVVHNCTVTGTGVNPCAADDDRITDGWLRRDLNELGFMWDVPQGTDGQGIFPYPYVRTLVVNATTKALVGDDFVWNSDGAFFLPSAAVNARGHVGGTYAFAGDVIGAGTGPYYPQCSAWLYDDITTQTYGNWTLADNIGVTAGTGNPTGSRFGDYFRTRINSVNANQWLGACYAIEGGSPVPHVVRFGRERDYHIVIQFVPDNGATVCRTPYIIVKILLSDLMRNPNGTFNPSSVTFTLDGGNILNLSSIRVPQTAPHAWAHIMYQPQADLSLGSHTAVFTFPDVPGTVTETRIFTAADMACAPPVLLSALVDEQTVELQQAPAALFTGDTSRQSLISPAEGSGASNTNPQQPAPPANSAGTQPRERDPERPERAVPQGGAFSPAPGSAQPASPVILPAFPVDEIAWTGWNMEPARPVLIDLKRR